MTDREPPPDHLAFLKSLRHDRRFLDKPVPQEVVDDLIAAARDTAGGDAGSWQFLVIDDRVTRLALAGAGAFSQVLGSTPVVVVALHEGTAAPSKANMEGRIADAIMRAAGEHGLAGGSSWFSTSDAQAEARAILGVPPSRQVSVAVGVGYLDDDAPDDATPLQRVRRSLDRLAGLPPTSKPEGR